MAINYLHNTNSTYAIYDADIFVEFTTLLKSQPVTCLNLPAQYSTVLTIANIINIITIQT